MRRVIGSIVLAIGTSAVATSASAADCTGLKGLALPATSITIAEVRPAGPYPFGDPAPTQPPNIPGETLPGFCRVVGVIEPAIGFEVWMPLEGWNGKFQGIGNHRFAGEVPQSDMAMELARGYAVAGTDTGHVGEMPNWMRDKQKLIDYGYRGIHEMTEKAKDIVKAFYGEGPRFSYFNGCSTGGKQGLTEAQRYPSDYHGILVGDPNNSQSGNRAQYVWMAQVTFAKPETTIPASKLPLLHAAAMNACDAADGLKDGVIANPLACRFDPEVLQCKPDDIKSACFSPAQVSAIKKVYEGPRNPRTGESIYPGLAIGSELSWGAFVGGPRLFPTATQFFGNIVFGDPNWDYRTFDFDKGLAAVNDKAAAIVDAVDPDLSAFRKAGGKILHTHGWADVNHTPLYAVEYYENVRKTMGEDEAASFYRLFLQPAGPGCGGRYDALPALEKWVESGIAPETIVAPTAIKADQGAATQRTRPMCPYPKVARWTGAGSSDDAASFSCQ